jgi:hypothetical protein
MPAPFQVGQAKFDLAIETAGTEQGRIERARPVGRHEDLGVAARVKAVHFRDNLQHDPLFLVVAATFVAAGPGPADGVNLVEKDGARALGPGHGKEFAVHRDVFAHVLLRFAMPRADKVLPVRGLVDKFWLEIFQ